MSSVQYFREFMNERLTAAAEEIFRVFQKTVVEYEEEIDRQRRLLNIVLKPEIKLHRTELPQQHVCKEEEEEEEEVLADNQLCNQERNSSLDQEDPEPPQIKEEQEELCTSLEGKQLALKQKESDNIEDQTLDLSPDETQSEAEKKHFLIKLVKNSVLPDPNVCNTTMSKTQLKSSSGRKVLKCEICGKGFRGICHLRIHHRVHTGEKPYSCNTCGKRFSVQCTLKVHMRVHTGEKPFTCNTCGRRFSQLGGLKVHMKVHTGEKPYPCNICEKRFTNTSALKVHMTVHTGEKPYSCNICEKRFSEPGNLKAHMRTHTGEKPYSCNTCEKRFALLGNLKAHMTTHR